MVKWESLGSFMIFDPWLVQISAGNTDANKEATNGAKPLGTYNKKNRTQIERMVLGNGK